MTFDEQISAACGEATERRSLLRSLCRATPTPSPHVITRTANGVAVRGAILLLLLLLGAQSSSSQIT